ncbi:ADP-ribosylglycohydrolase family protein [Paenibacillus beijingensis]|uniref:Crystallin n=1 Tax=Paenibacillus beijingensis TaxID=1126833 RepID=A0A0D5NG02_9BACL|nr:ADP-ribosylglycohydrolase family protein [Paenibacillus beijingensis]AJY74309.1 crystallin [Paenibacillus beijingensis]
MKISQHAYLQYALHVEIEYEQALDEGRIIAPKLEEEYAQIKALDLWDPQREKLAAGFLDEMEKMAIRVDYPYAEPSDLPGILAAKPSEYNSEAVPVSREKLTDKIYGAWLARCAGCLLGHPIEGWQRERILGLLKETGNLPIRYYISSEIDSSIAEKYGVKNTPGSYGNDSVSWINNVKHMVEDDDMNYTIIGLAIVEQYGFDFTPDDVAEAWLRYLPILRTCTAERIAYRNLLNLMDPPRSASYRNSYREWIGAQIRADLFGYVNPGNPEKAAEMAWRDASISHVKNGIYGEMWVAAMLASAAVTDDLESIVLAGLRQIPEKCRMAEHIVRVMDWKRKGDGFDEAVARIREEYDENNVHHWCHAVSNAMIVAAALLYGEGDLEATLGMAVVPGFDTDCNGATAGSVLGMRNGASALPDKWIAPLNDKIRSGVEGFGIVPLSDLANRTVRLIEQNPYVCMK